MPSLSPLDIPLDLRLAKHLLRRATFNYSKEQLEVFVGMSATDAINSIATNPDNMVSEPYDPLPKESPDGYWTSSSELPNSFSGQVRKRAHISAWWWYNAVNQTENLINNKLSLNLSHLNSGVYIFEILANNKKEIHKVIKI